MRWNDTGFLHRGRSHRACCAVALVLVSRAAGHLAQTDSQVAVINGASGNVGNTIALRDVLIPHPSHQAGGYPIGSTVPVLVDAVGFGGTYWVGKGALPRARLSVFDPHPRVGQGAAGTLGWIGAHGGDGISSGQAVRARAVWIDLDVMFPLPPDHRRRVVADGLDLTGWVPGMLKWWVRGSRGEWYGVVWVRRATAPEMFG
jgi:hypothetical protein